MAKRRASANPVTAYLAARPPDARARLRQTRSIIRRMAPRATEVISYGIPAFKLDGRILVWYAAWKDHSSLYPIDAATRRLADAKGFKTSKGTLRMPYAKPLPITIVKQFVKARVAGSGGVRR